MNLQADEQAISAQLVAPTTLAKSVKSFALQHPEKSGFFTLTQGTEALAARLRLIEAAEKTLDVQYYIWHDDTVGKTLQYYLLNAAERGVKVRLLLDDLDTAGKDDRLLALDQHPNIQVRTFNPFPNRNSRWKDFLTSSTRINRRMHNKSMTADRSATILGGRNIGDEYFDASTLVNFADIDVLALGRVGEAVAGSFDLYWNSEYAFPITQLAQPKNGSVESIERLSAMYKSVLSIEIKSPYSAALKHAEFNSYKALDQVPFHWSEWKLAYDQPIKVTSKSVAAETHLAPQLIAVANDAKSSLIIVSPYFVPGEKFTAYLTGLVKTGVSVRILTNSLASNDVSLVHAGYQRYRKKLVEGGVELYELKPDARNLETLTSDTTSAPTPAATPAAGKKKRWLGASKSSLHGKYFGFDRVAVFVGSFNLDGRSVELNTELGVFFKDDEYAKMLDDNFTENTPLKAYKIQLSKKGAIEWHSIENGESVVYTKEPKTSFWHRFSTTVLSFIVPEKQL
ncbi:MAG TPA: phospholipase D family protein [Cellvibrio sp.]|nr:phospholipase D family protein [Cellvibrio sp.]